MHHHAIEWHVRKLLQQASCHLTGPGAPESHTSSLWVLPNLSNSKSSSMALWTFVFLALSNLIDWHASVVCLSVKFTMADSSPITNVFLVKHYLGIDHGSPYPHPFLLIPDTRPFPSNCSSYSRVFSSARPSAAGHSPKKVPPQRMVSLTACQH